MHRLVGNGMDHDDAARLHELAVAGVAWADAAIALGEAKLALAHAASTAGYTVSARTFAWHAAAAFRFGQSAMVFDDPPKIALYRRALDAFVLGATLADPPYEKVAIPFEDGQLLGWLMRPHGVAAPPVVIIFGGADGWREEYHGAGLALVERGVAALLLDGPGQGETRILGGLHLRPGVERAFATAVRFLVRDPRVGDRVGVWGNSLGGCFAARTASHAPLVAACCVNGGTWLPGEILARFPRFIQRMLAMVGTEDADLARHVLEAHTLPQLDNHIACPLLVLHGDSDRLFSHSHAEEVATWAPSTDKRVDAPILVKWH